jgi:5-methyltetrahydrofolate--homocysteine methyltransferase
LATSARLEPAFPVADAPGYGRHFLNAVAVPLVDAVAVPLVSKEFGQAAHITGGTSNVSFGLPKRRLVNDTFLYLALKRGADSGIINPLETSPSGAFALDLQSEPVKIAMDMLLGDDEYCVKFLQAFRAGKLG